MASDENLIPTLAGVAAMFEAAMSLLLKAQASVPVPSLKEIAEMRQGKRPLTREAFLAGLLQRSLVGAENLASDLQAIDEEALSHVHEFELTALEFNAMEEAAVRSRS